jgi:hypothetical protein
MQEKRQNISPIKQRILYFAESLMISKREFYTKIGVSRGTLESNTGITEDIMAKFIATYPDISLDWLICGTGSMLRKQNVQNKERTSNNTVDADADLQGKNTDNVVIEQKKDTIIEELLNRLEKQSEVIGALKQENTQLRRQLQKKSNQHYPDATDAECAAAV